MTWSEPVELSSGTFVETLGERDAHFLLGLLRGGEYVVLVLLAAILPP